MTRQPSSATLPEFAIIIDSREQAPLHFPGVPTLRRCLPEGDYTCVGLEGRVAIERKSVGDLVGSLTYGRERFFRELERLRGYAFSALVVEGSMGAIASGAYRSKAHPSSIIGSVVAIMADYGMPVVFADGAEGAATVTEKLLRRLHRAHFEGAADAA